MIEALMSFILRHRSLAICSFSKKLLQNYYIVCAICKFSFWAFFHLQRMLLRRLPFCSWYWYYH